jgi:hypothetical protein
LPTPIFIYVFRSCTGVVSFVSFGPWFYFSHSDLCQVCFSQGCAFLADFCCLFPFCHSCSLASGSYARSVCCRCLLQFLASAVAQWPLTSGVCFSWLIHFALIFSCSSSSLIRGLHFSVLPICCRFALDAAPHLDFLRSSFGLQLPIQHLSVSLNFAFAGWPHVDQLLLHCWIAIARSVHCCFSILGVAPRLVSRSCHLVCVLCLRLSQV